MKFEIPQKVLWFRTSIPSSNSFCMCFSKENKITNLERHMCAPLFIIALFTIAKVWKQPTCPLLDEWVKQM